MKTTRFLLLIMFSVLLLTGSLAVGGPLLPGPPLPGPPPLTSVPVPTDPLASMQICEQQASSPVLCVLRMGVTVGHNVTLFLKSSATLPTSVSIAVNGAPHVFKVDPTTGSMGTFSVPSAGVWRLVLAPTRTSHGATLILHAWNPVPKS